MRNGRKGHHNENAYGGGRALTLALIMAGLLTLALVGCGRGAEPVDLEGYWVSESQEKPLPSTLEKHGMFTVYQFGENNSFRIISCLPNHDPLTREGTYETNNEKVQVNVPAEQVTVTDGATLPLVALDNVEIKRDGDKLILAAFPPKDQEIVLVRLSDEQYQEMARTNASAVKEES